jgi:hypothetical protein
MSENATANAWRLLLMAVVVLAGLAAITGTLVQVGPWVGGLLATSAKADRG